MLFLVRINGCILVRFSWIKMNMPDRIIDDKWINLECWNMSAFFYLIDMNNKDCLSNMINGEIRINE